MKIRRVWNVMFTMERLAARQVAASLATGMGALLLVVGVLLSHASQALFQEEGFSRRAAQSLGDTRVSSYVATEITDAVIRENRDLVTVRPLLVGSVEAIISSSAAQTVVRTATRAVHRLLFTDTGADILFTLDDISVLVRSTLEQTHPAVAERIPERLSIRLQERFDLEDPPGRIASWVRRVADGMWWWAALVLGLGIVLSLWGAFAALPVSGGFIRLGVMLVASAVSLLLVRQWGGDHLGSLSPQPALASAVGGLWDSFMIGLGTWTLGLTLMGLTLAAIPVGAALQAESRSLLRELWAWAFRTPGDGGTRAVRALLLLVAGLLLVLHPARMLSFLAAGGGAALVFFGLVELFSILMLVVSGRTWVVRTELASQVRCQWKVGALIVAVAVVTLNASALVLVPAAERMRKPGLACNGMLELCGVPISEVVFPTTHNSMAAADQPGWLIPNQELGIERQLADGVRGLMIDVYYGYPAGNQILTEISDEARAREGYERVVGQEGLEAALRIRRRLLGEPRGARDLYLCHGFCEVGATPLREGLRTIARFLDDNPREVLVIVVEDDDLDPRDFARAVEQAGLIEHVYRGPIQEPWPTLGEMIERGERVLIGAEVSGGNVSWYHSAYEGLIRETPYHFESLEEFSCQPHRGDDRGELFLLNHWITAPPAPLPSRAEVVNSEPVLMHRVEQCARERRALPNLVAVDFYRTGGLFEVVRALNRRTVGKGRPAR